MTLSNQTKNSVTLTQPTKNPQTTWDEATYTWNEAEGTWEVPNINLTRQTKNSVSLSNEAKN